MHSQAMIRGGHTQGSLKLTHVNIRSSKKYLGSVKPNGIYFKETYWKKSKKKNLLAQPEVSELDK